MSDGKYPGWNEFLIIFTFTYFVLTNKPVYTSTGLRAIFLIWICAGNYNDAM